MNFRFCVLGTFDVRDGTATVDIGPHKQRLLLATLLSRANTVVSVDQLIEAIWDDAPPRTARKNLQAYVSTLRKIVGPRISHTGYGYLIKCDAAELDLIRFEDAVAQARIANRAGDIDGAATALAAALAQWRGPFLADMPRSPVLEAEHVRLAERRLRVCEDWAEAAGRLGDHRDVLDVIDALADAHPERERLAMAKLTALYQCGRRQEALAYYEFIRAALADELGLDPSPAMQRLFRAILAGEPIGVTGARDPVGQVADTPTDPVGTGQKRRPGSDPGPDTESAIRGCGDPLPTDLADFIGREREIGRLVDGFGKACDDAATAVVTGPVGAGKTALAVHVAHLAAAQFPDGVLYAAMREHDRRPRSGPAVLAGLAATVGLTLVDPGLPEASAAWRAWLSDRRVLIVLDDARDEASVRALQPGRGASRMVVTSRFRLSGLDGVRRVELDDLSTAEAVELTAKVAGFDAVLARPDEIARQLSRCGRSPLAVRILAGRMRHLAGPPVRDDGGDLLDQLVLGDLSVAGRCREHCADLPAADLRVLATLAGAAGLPYRAATVGSIDPATDRAIDSLVEAHLLRRPEGDVVAHADVYEIPSIAFEYARTRL